MYKKHNHFTQHLFIHRHDHCTNNPGIGTRFIIKNELTKYQENIFNKINNSEKAKLKIGTQTCGVSQEI